MDLISYACEASLASGENQGPATSLSPEGVYVARLLATALTKNPTDHEAFGQYQAQHGQLVGPRQRNVWLSRPRSITATTGLPLLRC